RAVFFYPVLLSPVVVALVWKWILQRQGVLNATLTGVGLSPVNWLLDAHWAFIWTIFISTWAHLGFYTLILLAGLQAIPRDVYEAAAMDNAGPSRTFWRITLPLLMPNLAVVVVLALVRAIQVFDEVYVFTGGGPGSATTYLVQFIYQTAFAQQIRQYGLSAAASLLLAGAICILTLAYLRVTRQRSAQ
ncbi:MAG: sugar ABC transporter permease, partial [Pseudolabrys sp.]|nr:sugar ABC transporter permease [Pseudolabrys sp.]